MAKIGSVLVVGAGSGLSASIARRFAREGAKLVLAARQTEDLAELVRETGAVAIGCDASNEADVNALFAACDAKVDPKAPGTYVFDCRGPDVPPPPNYTVLSWTVTGRVKVP